MKKLRLLTIPILLLAASLVGCVGQTAVQTVGGTLISMHDVVKTSATAASAACDRKAIPDDLCKKMLTAYKTFQLSWPVVDDAWLTYSKAPATDSGATAAFNAAHTVFTNDYNSIMTLLSQTGVIKAGGTP